MILYHNDQFIENSTCSVPYTNRAFQYGDGFFDTIISNKGTIQYFNDHFTRLQKGLKLLSLNNALLSNKEELLKVMNDLLLKNNLRDRARIKIIVYRNTGGLFSPDSNDAGCIIDCKAIDPVELKVKAHAIYSEKYQNYLQPHSCIKTLSSLKYVLCGLEMKQANANDVIILDNDGNISECLQSSIFWIENNTIYTPTIDTGCIEGVMRNQIINYCNSKGLPIKIGFFTPSKLSYADIVFTSNVAGLSPIKKIGQSTFKVEHPIFNELYNALS
jgi:4-amino-4-deoxychorismate lyase